MDLLFLILKSFSKKSTTISKSALGFGLTIPRRLLNPINDVFLKLGFACRIALTRSFKYFLVRCVLFVSAQLLFLIINRENFFAEKRDVSELFSPFAYFVRALVFRFPLWAALLFFEHLRVILDGRLFAPSPLVKVFYVVHVRLPS